MALLTTTKEEIDGTTVVTSKFLLLKQTAPGMCDDLRIRFGTSSHTVNRADADAYLAELSLLYEKGLGAQPQAGFI